MIELLQKEVEPDIECIHDYQERVKAVLHLIERSKLEQEPAKPPSENTPGPLAVETGKVSSPEGRTPGSAKSIVDDDDELLSAVQSPYP